MAARRLGKPILKIKEWREPPYIFPGFYTAGDPVPVGVFVHARGFSARIRPPRKDHDPTFCACGHAHRNHEDVGSLIDGNWGMGSCEICGCKKFCCVVCQAQEKARLISE